MKKSSILFIILVLLTITISAQEKDSIARINLTTISQVNQGNSYVTFPTDIGNIEPLWFEGNLIPNFYLRKSKNSRLMGVLTPQVIIRMYQEYSYPVKTPSYIPQVTLYYMLNTSEHANMTTLYGRLAHHSNGQDGDFLLENGEFNVESGDFSTNFFELGVIRTRYSKQFNAYQFFKSSFEVHPDNWDQWELDGIYSKYRWHNAFSIFKLHAENSEERKKANFSVKGELTWMFGDFNELDAISSERLNMSLTLYYHPGFLEDIGFFVQYYHGSDYYNMYFDHRLDVMRFGFMTEKLRF
jgi:hypothetical protein